MKFEVRRFASFFYLILISRKMFVQKIEFTKILSDGVAVKILEDLGHAETVRRGSLHRPVGTGGVGAGAGAPQ